MDSEPRAAEPGPPAIRRILHVDMDAFYASVEQRDDPALRGRPVAVGGRPEGRGVVAAASYEARAFGVRSAIPMARAVRLCPELVIVRPDFARYKRASDQVFELFREVTPLVEPMSLDEAYLDVTENAWHERLGMRVARRLKDAIRERTQLTASAGVAPNKFLAKIASGWQKPDGLTVIAPERVEHFLHGLDVDALWGVGPVTARKLRACGIAKLVDVRTADIEHLRGAVGSLAEWLQQLARGVDHATRGGDIRAQVRGQRDHVRRGPDRYGRDARGAGEPGWRRGGLSDQPRSVRAHRDDQGPLRRLLHRDAEPYEQAGAVGRGTGGAGVRAPGQDRSRSTPGAAARRERAQPGPA